MVMAGNGSDDLLTILTRAFVGPGDPAAFATPSYLLYSTLIQLQDGRSVVVPYSTDWTLDPAALAVPGLKLFCLANPDSPSGTALTRDQIAELAEALDCPLVVDEAYADFADPRYHACPLLRDHPNVIVTRSFSKGYSLAGHPPGIPGRPARDRRRTCQGQGLVQLRHAQPGRGRRGARGSRLSGQTRSKILATRARLTAALAAWDMRSPRASPISSGRPAVRRRGATFQQLKDRQDPGSPDELSRISRGPADHHRDRRGDRRAPGESRPVDLAAGQSELQLRRDPRRAGRPVRTSERTACFAVLQDYDLSVPERTAEIVREDPRDRHPPDASTSTARAGPRSRRASGSSTTCSSCSPAIRWWT